MNLLNPITAPLNVKKVMDCLQTSLLILREFKQIISFFLPPAIIRKLYQASAWGVQSHAYAFAHAWNIRDMQKKARLVWFKKLQGVRQIARRKQLVFFIFHFL